MKRITISITFLFLLALLGCDRREGMVAKEGAEMIQPTAEPGTAEPVERKLIKEGRVEFETDNLSSARKTILDAVGKYKAYVSSDQEFKSTARRSNTIEIRVPAADFDNLLKDATQGVEKYDSKEINVKDVTEEFLDIQARLKTKKELESRYLALLKQAKNVIEILEIEKQIGQLRADIESIEGRLNYLQSRVSFSTLTITFYERLSNETEFGMKFKNGFKNGWDNLVWFFVALVNVWPFVLIGLGLVIGTMVYRRRK